MTTLQVYLPDGSAQTLEEGTTAAEVAARIGPRLAKQALAARVNNKLVDLSSRLEDGDRLEIITTSSPEALGILRHSSAHILAESIWTLWPQARFGVGPAIEDGFYYDIELDRQLSLDDFSLIEAQMAKIVQKALPFKREIISRNEARQLFASQPLKLELIDELPANEVLSVYRQGDFFDLCRGPHVPNSGWIKAFKLTKLSGAYWRGDRERQMLQRVYGTAWFSHKDMETYLRRQEEAQKRDHRKLGRELGIFMMNDQAGVGLPLYPPAGARVIRLLQEWLRKQLLARGYEEVITPHIYNAEIWKRSGHYYFYRDNMYFFEVDEGEGSANSVGSFSSDPNFDFAPVGSSTPGQSGAFGENASGGSGSSAASGKHSEYGLKPMNCPGHVLLYANQLRSYRELPLRYFEFGTVYRHELSGVVQGLLRARGFTQDDAHVFCRPDQVLDEVDDILDFIDFVMKSFDFSYTAEISTRPAKSIGSSEKWEFATEQLRAACERHGLTYDINAGDGAFYGPKIDIKVKDAIGRTWQCSTIQVDFNFPERFDLSYRTADNSTAQPWMLHRAILGSIERFLAILIEHYAGALPLWLSPVQVVMVPLADRHLDYAQQVAAQLRQEALRVEVAAQKEPLKVKLAQAQQRQIPYMLVVGDKEQESATVSVRERRQGDLGTHRLSDFLARVTAEGAQI
ncbi:MAG: threonine--tRNA ligase [Coriobacteriales bacterium]|jgi:threonyl-tRNA synthetase|nr:threonine--tRNA ligase [Coriobacteriales bacterium]